MGACSKSEPITFCTWRVKKAVSFVALPLFNLREQIKELNI